MTYSVYEFFTKDEIERSVLISLLNDYHFEGFEETEESLKAYVPSDKVKTLDIKSLLAQDELAHIRFQSEQLEDKNWNEEWEKNFEPVVIANRVGIRAPFHQPLKTDIELIIEPKMSFGTGHHPTTSSVIELMLKENFAGKSVLDFGSGTGVLAILAERLGAKEILAIDHEEWAFNNCLENIERNHCRLVKAIRGADTSMLHDQYDFILANINRNVILEMMSSWVGLLKRGGVMITSGFLKNDEADITREAEKLKLSVKDILRNKEWTAMSFVRQ